MLWFIKITRPYFEQIRDGEKVTVPMGENTEAFAALFQSLLDELRPTSEQIQKLIELSDVGKASGSEGYEVGLFDYLENISNDADTKLNHLEQLVMNNTACLETQMRELHGIFSVKQIAKFVIWVDKNPACMQLLEALWPHLTDNVEKATNK
jgi:hypothetical protein